MIAFKEAWSELLLDAQEAEVHWGSAFAGPVKTLNTCRAKYIAAVWEYCWLHGAAPSWATVDRNPARLQRVEETVFLVGEDPEADPFLQSIGGALEKAEALLRPYLGR